MNPSCSTQKKGNSLNLSPLNWSVCDAQSLFLHMTYILETSRLRLRLLTYDDAAFIVRLMNTPGWLAFIGDRDVRSEEAARSYLRNGPLKSYRDNGFGLYLVETKD